MWVNFISISIIIAYSFVLFYDMEAKLSKQTVQSIIASMT